MRVAWLSSLGEVAAEAWNALVAPDDPFTDYRFLAALEASGAVGGDAGWRPAHVAVYDAAGALAGAAPFYRKTDSYGEFIFDFAWANAAHRAGIAYYPKYVSAVPFTPATGNRFLVRPGADAPAVREALARGMLERAAREGASSVHVLFLADDEAAQLAGEPWLRRLTYQFHWENAGYASFEDYLASLRAPSRKAVRKERREAAQGLRLATVGGREMDDREWAMLYGFYRATAERKGGFAYLPRAFFERIRETYAEHVLATFAYDAAGAPVAGAVAFTKGRGLYGRYWGTLTGAPMLHFELCYYRFIEWGIERGIARFEAGAQGEHKLKRGFLPRATHSLHALAHPGLRDAVARHLAGERRGVQGEMDELAEFTPFRRG